jgi:hypothetical protein
MLSIVWLELTTGSAGTVSAALPHDPWGVPRSSVPSGYTPFRFQGSWHDPATDISWVVTRWYAPSLGWIGSPSPMTAKDRRGRGFGV